MSGIPQVVLTGDDVKRLRVGDIRKAIASDGSPLLLVVDTSPSRQHITWPGRIVLTAGELDLIETDPGAGQIVTVEDQPDLIFHVVGEPR